MADGDFFGERVRFIRKEVLKMTQKEFIDGLNDFIGSNEEFKKKEIRPFAQDYLSLLENKSKITSKKMLALLNYLHQEHKVNPSWITIADNQNISQYTGVREIEGDLKSKQQEILEMQKTLSLLVNEVAIIIDNKLN